MKKAKTTDVAEYNVSEPSNCNCCQILWSIREILGILGILSFHFTVSNWVSIILRVSVTTHWLICSLYIWLFVHVFCDWADLPLKVEILSLFAKVLAYCFDFTVSLELPFTIAVGHHTYPPPLFDCWVLTHKQTQTTHIHSTFDLWGRLARITSLFTSAPRPPPLILFILQFRLFQRIWVLDKRQ